MIKILNQQVALKPLVFEHDKGQSTQTIKGFAGTDKLNKSLISTEVIFNSENFKSGQKVFVRADVYNLPQAKAILKLNEQEFILFPENMVVAVDNE